MKRRAFICGGMAAILASRRAPAFCVAMRNGTMRQSAPPPPPAGNEMFRDAAGRTFISPQAVQRPRPPLAAKILGPAPAPFAKLRGNYRFHLQALGAPGDLLREAAERVCAAKLKTPRDVQWIVDVDPLDSL